MGDRGTYSPRRLASFDRDIRKAMKERFGKARRAARKFEAFVNTVVSKVSANPFAEHYGDGIYGNTEGYPNGYARDDCLVRKVRFTIEGLDGGARLGRVLVDVDRPTGVVTFLAFYTHADVPNNYEDSKLIERLKERGRAAD